MSTTNDADPTKPLRGVTVLEIGHSVAAPFAGLVLANLGAKVVKIEQAAGDPTRRWGPPFTDRSAVTFETMNREKDSVVADLKDDQMRAALKNYILSEVDIVLQNLRFGALERMELGAASLLKEKPSLLYSTIGAYGQNGPLNEKPGYDPLVQAASGIMSVLGSEGDALSRIPGSVLDMATGMWSVIGVLSALHRRAETGLGGEINVSLYESALAFMSLPINEYLGSGPAPQRLGSSHSTTSPSGAFQTADGWIMIAVGNDAQFSGLCEALEAPALQADPLFAANPDRVRNRKDLYARIGAIFMSRKTQDWTEILTDWQVPCSPIHTIPEVLQHPQTKALDIVQSDTDGAVQAVGLPIMFDGQRHPFEKRAPALGEHTNEYLPPTRPGERQ